MFFTMNYEYDYAYAKWQVDLHATLMQYRNLNFFLCDMKYSCANYSRSLTGLQDSRKFGNMKISPHTVYPSPY